MFDDGAHNDGASGDGVYGATIPVGVSDIQYYIYSDNNNAGKFSPQRAEHEYHSLAVTGDLVINEISASNSTIEADADEAFYGETGDELGQVKPPIKRKGEYPRFENVVPTFNKKQRPCLIAVVEH